MTIHRLTFHGAYITTRTGRGVGIIIGTRKIRYRPPDINILGVLRIWYK